VNRQSFTKPRYKSAGSSSGVARNLSWGDVLLTSKWPKFEAIGRQRREEGLGGSSQPPPYQLGGLGSAIRSPSRVQGRALTANAFWTH